MSILVIVITYNGMRWMERCLSSVKNSTIKADLFIVDNGSSDGTIEYIKENYSECQLIESKENLGFGRANNLGFLYAINNNYDYIYLLNQDAWVEPSLFQCLINIQQANPIFGILSPLQTNKEQTKLDHKFLKNACPEDMISEAIIRSKLKTIYETNFVMAAHWLLPTSVVRKVGGFSPTFPHYGEDGNFIDRLHYWNYKVGIVPHAVGVHDREKSIISTTKSVYIESMHWRQYFSNPIESTKTRVTKFIKSYGSSLIRDPWATIKNSWIFILNINTIRRNSKLQKMRSAFLITNEDIF